MATFSRLGTLAACVIATACGGSANVDEIEGSGAGGAAGTNAGGTAGNTADGTGGDDGGAGGDAGSAGSGGSNAAGADAAGSGGSAGSAGSGEESDILFEEHFEDGDTDDWFRTCATFEAVQEAAANSSSFGAHLFETREESCELGHAAIGLADLTPSRIEWWMKANPRGEVFASILIPDTMSVHATAGMVVVYDVDDVKVFDIDGSRWHRYELHDIDWTNHTYSFSVDGDVQATDLGFELPVGVATAIFFLAAARDISTTPPMSMFVDDVVVYR